jgi:hypothetical protein
MWHSARRGVTLVSLPFKRTLVSLPFKGRAGVGMVLATSHQPVDVISAALFSLLFKGRARLGMVLGAIDSPSNTIPTQPSP